MHIETLKIFCDVVENQSGALVRGAWECVPVIHLIGFRSAGGPDARRPEPENRRVAEPT